MATRDEIKGRLIEVLEEHQVGNPINIANDQLDLLADVIEIDDEDDPEDEEKEED